MNALGICILILCADTESDITSRTIATRLDAIEQSIERLEATGSTEFGSLQVELSGMETGSMNWSILSAASAEVQTSVPFVIERDFGSKLFYFEWNSDAQRGIREFVHFNGARSTQVNYVPDQIFPAATIKAEFPSKHLDGADGVARWDSLWLRPLERASIADVLVQTEVQTLNEHFASPIGRFRLNGVAGAEGKRIVDISIAQLERNLETPNEVSYFSYVYRLTLAEEHSFSPLAVCKIARKPLNGDLSKVLDGDAYQVILFEDYRTKEGIPVPFQISQYSIADGGQVLSSRTRIERAEFNDEAKVRDHLDIPAGAYVSDEIQGVDYRQRENGALPIDKVAADTLKEIKKKELEVIAEEAKSRRAAAASRQVTMETPLKPQGSSASAIWIGLALGLLAAMGVWTVRRRSR